MLGKTRGVFIQQQGRHVSHQTGMLWSTSWKSHWIYIHVLCHACGTSVRQVAAFPHANLCATKKTSPTVLDSQKQSGWEGNGGWNSRCRCTARWLSAECCSFSLPQNLRCSRHRSHTKPWSGIHFAPMNGNIGDNTFVAPGGVASATNKQHDRILPPELVFFSFASLWRFLCRTNLLVAGDSCHGLRTTLKSSIGLLRTFVQYT